jgi:ADP-heptose:LPS heptosyltransferase
VQTTPVLRQIREDLPDADITLFSSANVSAVWEGCPYFDYLHSLPTQWLNPAATRWGILRAWWEISLQGPFNLFFSLEPTWQRNIGIKLIRATKTLGIRFSGGSWKPSPFSHSVTLAGDPTSVTEHTSLRNVQAWCQLWHSEDRGHGYDMSHLIHGQSTLPADTICLAPGTGSALDFYSTKAWGAKRFAALGQALLASGQPVAYLGGTDDMAGESVPAGAVDLLGQTSISEAATLLSQSRCLVGNDSGLFHLAQGVGCPVAGIFGPTSARVTGVFRKAKGTVLSASLPCLPCHKKECLVEGNVAAPQAERPFCMSEVTVEQVLHAITTI